MASISANNNHFEGLSLSNTSKLLGTVDKERLVTVTFVVESGDTVVRLKQLADRHPEAKAEVSSAVKGRFFKHLEVTVEGKAWFVKSVVDNIKVG
jgi:hypothetical protein